MKKPSIENLSKYFTATVGATCIASSADAAIVVLDVSGFSGPNGGLANGTSGSIALASGTLNIWNNAYTGFGNSLGFSVTGFTAGIAAGTGYTSPVQVSLGATIDNSTGNFISNSDNTVFKLYYAGTQTAANFGPNTFLAFRDAVGNFGWIEATWDGTTFNLLGAAYEDSGAPIVAGAVVPEPSSLALLAMGATGLCAFRRRKRASSSSIKSVAPHP